jgi:hypothetical protein
MNTPIAPFAGDNIRLIAARLHRMHLLREELAAALWSLWLQTPAGLRYQEAPTSFGAIGGWHWVARQFRIMADQVEDLPPGDAT